jgi:ribosomal subunit interface protein
MKLNIKTTNVTLTPQISEYVTKRLEKIETIVRDDPSVLCDVELARTTEHHQKGDIFKAEIHLVGAGRNCYSSSEKVDLFTAVDDVRDEILRELKAGKGKRISLVRRSGARVKNMIRGMWPWRK